MKLKGRFLLIFFLLWLGLSVTFAQSEEFHIDDANKRVKIKKDKVLIDGKEVFSLQFDKKTKEILYKTLDSEEVLLKAIYGGQEVGESYIVYVEVYHPTTGKMNSVDIGSYTGTLNNRKATTSFLMGKYGLFDVDGIDKSKIDDFFAKDLVRESIKSGEEAAAKKVADNALIYEKEPFVGSDLVVKYGGSLGNVVGKIEFKPKGVQDQFAFYEIYNENDGKLIAKAKANLIDGVFIEAHDGKEYSFDDSIKTDDGAQSGLYLIKKLIVLGYPLDVDLHAEAVAKYKETVANTINIYNASGYVIKEGGEKLEGRISIEWEYLDNPDIERHPTDVRSAKREVGKRVRIDYINEDNKEKHAYFSAEGGTTFGVLDSAGKETRYAGLRAGKSRVSYKEYFFENVAAYDKIEVFITKDGRYILKRKDMEYGQLVEVDYLNDKTFDAINEYLSDFEYDPIDKLTFDSKDIEDVLKLVESYNSH